jgi:cold shock CspA family protein
MDKERDVGRVEWFDPMKKRGKISTLEKGEDFLFVLPGDDERTFAEGQMVAFTRKMTRIGIRAAEQIAAID